MSIMTQTKEFIRIFAVIKLKTHGTDRRIISKGSTARRR